MEKNGTQNTSKKQQIKSQRKKGSGGARKGSGRKKLSNKRVSIGHISIWQSAITTHFKGDEVRAQEVIQSYVDRTYPKTKD